MTWLPAALAGILPFFASLFGTRLALAFLKQRGILDHPNERSSHAVPIPRGGGLALVAVLLLAWLLLAFLTPGTERRVLWPLAAALGLAAVSWRDDLQALPIALRLAAHAAAVALGMASLVGAGPVFQGLLPLWLDHLGAGFLWLWFLNLFNFMDGIDGITGAETVSIGIGCALVALLGGLDGALPLYGIAAAAAALGFLWWNWQPARIFIGDVGSVPLGYLLAWLLLELAAAGLWAPALLLPLYYLADASLTLLSRIFRGERFWRAHRQHFYQRATEHGLSHAQVVEAMLVANLALIGAAIWASLASPWLPLALGGLTVAALLAFLSRARVAG